MKTKRLYTLLLVIGLLASLLSGCGVSRTPQQTKHTITFYTEQTVYGNLQTAGNERITLPQPPQKQGFDFIGWFFDNDLWKNQLTEDTYLNQPLLQDVSVWAYFTPQTQQYTVTFETNGGTPVEPITTDILSQQPQTSKEKFHFDGWFFDSDLTQQVVFPLTVTKDLTLFAKWEYAGPDPAVVTADGFEQNGQTLTYQQEVSESQLQLADKITVSEDSTWQIYTDVSCTPETIIESKIVPLADGTNTFFLLVSDSLSGKSQKYTILITKSADNTHTATLYRNGIQVGTFTATSGQDWNFPKPDESIYEFIGYYSDSDYTVPWSPSPATQDITVYEKSYYIGVTVNDTGSVTGFSSPVTEGEEVYLKIPQQIQNISVKSVNMQAFQNTDILSLDFEAEIDSLGYQAFSKCTNLQSINLEHVKSVSSQCFERCSNLTQVTWGTKLTSIGADAFRRSGIQETYLPQTIKSIGSYAFADCTKLISVTIVGPASIGLSAFSNCSNLQTLDLGDQITEIGNGAFSKCVSLEKVQIPETVSLIGLRAFADCTALQEITLPDVSIHIMGDIIDATAYYKNLQNWQEGALYVGNHLLEVNDQIDGKSRTSYDIREGTVTVADYALSVCSSLKQLTFPSSLRRIGSYMIGRSSLTSIVLPDGLISIGDYCFRNSPSLTSITLPDSVRDIGTDAFKGTGIYQNPANKDGNAVYLGNHLIQVNLPAGTTSYTVREGTVTISNSAFASSAIQQGSLPQSLVYIDSEAFSDSQLIEITIPESVTEIGPEAFKNCRNLQRLTLPNSLKKVAESAFEYCSSLTQLSLPSQLEEIGKSAFSGCGLTEVVIPAGIQIINDYAFGVQPNLKIFCEASSKPEGWSNNWDFGAKGRTVYWYSETPQAGCWHYVGQKPTPWEI